MLEGAAGTGKTALIEAAAELGGAMGMRVLRSRGSELESEFGFGVLRQLYERVLANSSEAERERLLAGAARPAERAVAAAHGGGSEPPPDELGALHAIQWLTLNLASDRPLLLVVDDAHWADATSLRALSYLAGRVGDGPIAIVCALRPNEPDAPEDLLDRVRGEPGARHIRLVGLSPAAVAAVVRERFPEASDAVCGACHAASAGNPLYLRELLRAATDEGLLRAANPEAALREASVRSLGEHVARRIARVDAAAPSLASAMAVLGDGAALALAGSLAGLAAPAPGRIAHRLRQIEVLAAEDPLAFVHPLVRRSVYEAIPAIDREGMHRAAAGLLAARGAPAEMVATHWRTIAPSGSAEAAAALVDAGEEALDRAAPEEAARWLQRALDEGAAEPDPAAILARLGITQLVSRDPQAVPNLERALDLAEDPDLVAHTAVALAETLFLAGRWDQAMSISVEVRRKLGAQNEAARAELAAIELMMSVYSPALQTDLTRPELDELVGREEWSAQALAAVMAAAAAHRGEPAERVTALVDRALADDRLVRERSASSFASAHVLIALVEIDDYERALAFSHEVSTAGRHSGSVHAIFTGADHRGWAQARIGNLPAAEAELRPSMETAASGGTPTVLGTQLFYLQDALAERTDIDDLSALAETFELDDETADTWTGAALSLVRGRLALRRRRRQLGVTYLRRSLEIARALGMGPTVAPFRSLLALALKPSAGDEAASLVAEELRLASATGLPRPKGVALRAAGILAGAEGVGQLRESVGALAHSGARLELARSRIELGAALRRAGHRTEARAEVTAGLELARWCGAHRTIERGNEELVAAGGRSRRAAGTGAQALTASELRVARLAARGATNPDIAQELFVSLKTVETHLSNTYAKLGLAGQGSRERLVQALAEPA